MKRWFVVHTHPNSEIKALLNLRRQGYFAYLPLYLKARRHSRRVDMVKRPLFPRYLFIEMDIDQTSWHEINSTFGVNHLVTSGRMPVAVPVGIIEDIKGSETKGGYVIVGGKEIFSEGQCLEIVEGPMAAYSGAFLRMSDSGRVEILLNLINRSVRVKLSRESVVAA